MDASFNLSLKTGAITAASDNKHVNACLHLCRLFSVAFLINIQIIKLIGHAEMAEMRDLVATKGDYKHHVGGTASSYNPHIIVNNSYRLNDM